MAWVCDICGRRPSVGNTVTRRGIAKKKGGFGRKTSGISKRRFKPNLQNVRALVGGRVKRLRVCTHCLKKGVVAKAG